LRGTIQSADGVGKSSSRTAKGLVGSRTGTRTVPGTVPWMRAHRYAQRLAGCFLAVALATAFVRVVPEANRFLWVANGVWLAYLLLAPRSRWGAYLAVGFAAQLAGGLAVHPQWQLNLLLAGLNTLEVLSSALMLRRRSSVLPDFTNRLYLLRFVAVAVIAVPLFIGFLFGMMDFLWHRAAIGSETLQWALSDGLGAGVTTPACVAIFRTDFKRTFNLGSNGICLLLVTALSFILCSQSELPIQFLVYPLLIVVLLRMGLGWASMATLMVAGAATWPLMHGEGPFAALPAQPLRPEVVLQLFIASAMFMLYSVSVVLESRRAIERRLQKIAALHNLVTENSRDVIIIADFDGNRSYVSASGESWGGWRREDLLNRKSLELVHPDDLPFVAQTLRKLRAGADGAVIEYRVRAKSGEYLWVEASLRTIRDPETKVPTGILNSTRDISERKIAEEKLQDAYHAVETMAITDGMTGLANRRRFDQCLAQEWRRGMREHLPLSLVLIDTDLFKNYNDTYGHLRGDACLKEIAQATREVVARPGDLVARFGGEEFAILLPNTGNEGAMHIAERIQAAIRGRMLPHGGSPFGFVTVSAGCATLIAQMGQDSGRLIEFADEALYSAKRNGRNQVRNCLRALRNAIRESERSRVSAKPV
jgi:diguanylate cyclase (GGDEF)-like protein/PAS domain S-box-containing protein